MGDYIYVHVIQSHCDTCLFGGPFFGTHVHSFFQCPRLPRVTCLCVVRSCSHFIPPPLLLLRRLSALVEFNTPPTFINNMYILHINNNISTYLLTYFATGSGGSLVARVTSLECKLRTSRSYSDSRQLHAIALPMLR